MCGDKETEPKATGQKPFQFTIRQIIYLTVGVALLCALWNILNEESLAYFIYILLSFYGLAFLYCTYSLPEVLRNYKAKTITVVAVILVVSHILIAIGSGAAAWNWRIRPEGINILFPYALFVLYFSQFMEYSYVHAVSIIGINMGAQTYIYITLLSIASKRKRIVVVSCGIGLFHLIAAAVANYIMWINGFYG